jgi:hypothetical protein
MRRKSFDHLVGASAQVERYRDAERLGGFEVDDHLDFCDLLDRQISRLIALEDPAAHLIDRRQRIADSQGGELFDPAREEWIRKNRWALPMLGT